MINILEADPEQKNYETRLRTVMFAYKKPSDHETGVPTPEDEYLSMLFKDYLNAIALGAAKIIYGRGKYFMKKLVPMFDNDPRDRGDVYREREPGVVIPVIPEFDALLKSSLSYFSLGRGSGSKMYIIQREIEIFPASDVELAMLDETEAKIAQSDQRRTQLRAFSPALQTQAVAAPGFDPSHFERIGFGGLPGAQTLPGFALPLQQSPRDVARPPSPLRAAAAARPPSPLRAAAAAAARPASPLRVGAGSPLRTGAAGSSLLGLPPRRDSPLRAGPGTPLSPLRAARPSSALR
ncbi:Hypothetical protein POVN_LOCUS66 [uncultured virus]|nr:Hypothetical protein POVN_LOCUS66 [uncultured virus]